MSAHVHSVHFYDKDKALIQRLWALTASSLQAEKAVLFIVTSEHAAAIRKYFNSRGLDCHGLERQGLLSLIDADSLLKQFTHGNTLDHSAFLLAVGGLLSSARQFAESKKLMAFGEMVAVLWERGERSAALQLEKWWNELLEQHDFHLHCAYPKHFFFGDSGAGAMEEICSHHSIVLGSTHAA